MSESYFVRVRKETLVFSAAHFITFNRNVCERLHGHNYAVEAEVHGSLDENHYVIDFIALRDNLKVITDAMDHRVLLPTLHPQIQVEQSGNEVVATFVEEGVADRRWVFPAGDCLLLPVENTTAELLAKSIGLQLLDRLQAADITRPEMLRIGVDENNGQWGIWTTDSPTVPLPGVL